MSEILYSDKIIEIQEDGILLKNFFPVLWHRKVLFTEISFIKILTPTLLNGKYRFSGSGDFKSWFNVDNSRHKREKIFLVFRENKWWRFGFTAEDNEAVIANLKDKVDLIFEA
ncbi:MAG: hypothetical protein KKA84_04500 [Bacteroidetes bacterium]|nr:hypothetical protein [Bacteroidota bacterium]